MQRKPLEARNIILESHLLSDLKLPADLAIVLRCNPKELAKRLKKRKYRKTKINENLLSEILDYCLINAIGNYGEGKVMQLDAGRNVSGKMLVEKIFAFEKTGKCFNARWLAGMESRALMALGK